jgi:hypothetical protein
MTMGPDNLGNGSATQERYASAYRGGRRDAEPGDDDLLPRNGAAPAGEAEHDLDRVRAMPSLDLHGLAEPVYPAAANWLEGSGSLADHPLLRGLLLELPPKGVAPPPGWLDRWFEAARCILELLYVQDRTH